MPEGDERTTSIKRGDMAGAEDTSSPLATVESTYMATLGWPRDGEGWKHVKPLKDGTVPHTSGSSWIGTNEGQRELVTTS